MRTLTSFLHVFSAALVAVFTVGCTCPQPAVVASPEPPATAATPPPAEPAPPPTEPDPTPAETPAPTKPDAPPDKTPDDPGSPTGPGTGDQKPGQGQPCPQGTCASGLTCVSYYGIAGPRGPKFTSCEIPCARDPGSCPEGQTCKTIADGPGQVCRRR